MKLTRLLLLMSALLLLAGCCDTNLVSSAIGLLVCFIAATFIGGIECVCP